MLKPIKNPVQKKSLKIKEDLRKESIEEEFSKKHENWSDSDVLTDYFWVDEQDNQKKCDKDKQRDENDNQKNEQDKQKNEQDNQKQKIKENKIRNFVNSKDADELKQMIERKLKSRLIVHSHVEKAERVPFFFSPFWRLVKTSNSSIFNSTINNKTLFYPRGFTSPIFVKSKMTLEKEKQSDHQPENSSESINTIAKPSNPIPIQPKQDKKDSERTFSISI